MMLFLKDLKEFLNKLDENLEIDLAYDLGETYIGEAPNVRFNLFVDHDDNAREEFTKHIVKLDEIAEKYFTARHIKYLKEETARHEKRLKELEQNAKEKK